MIIYLNHGLDELTMKTKLWPSLSTFSSKSFVFLWTMRWSKTRGPFFSPYGLGGKQWGCIALQCRNARLPKVIIARWFKCLLVPWPSRKLSKKRSRTEPGLAHASSKIIVSMTFCPPWMLFSTLRATRCFRSSDTNIDTSKRCTNSKTCCPRNKPELDMCKRVFQIQKKKINTEEKEKRLKKWIISIEDSWEAMANQFLP